MTLVDGQDIIQSSPDISVVCVYPCVCIPLILDVRFEDAPAGVTHEEGQTGFLHPPTTVLALVLIARRIQPSLSLVDRGVEFCVPANSLLSTWARFSWIFSRRYSLYLKTYVVTGVD